MQNISTVYVLTWRSTHTQLTKRAIKAAAPAVLGTFHTATSQESCVQCCPRRPSQL